MKKYKVAVTYWMIGDNSDTMGIMEHPCRFHTRVTADNETQAEDLAVGQLVRLARDAFKNDSMNIGAPEVEEV